METTRVYLPAPGGRPEPGNSGFAECRLSCEIVLTLHPPCEKVYEWLAPVAKLDRGTFRWDSGPSQRIFRETKSVSTISRRRPMSRRASGLIRAGLALLLGFTGAAMGVAAQTATHTTKNG